MNSLWTLLYHSYERYGTFCDQYEQAGKNLAPLVDAACAACGPHLEYDDYLQSKAEKQQLQAELKTTQVKLEAAQQTAKSRGALALTLMLLLMLVPVLLAAVLGPSDGALWLRGQAEGWLESLKSHQAVFSTTNSSSTHPTMDAALGSVVGEYFADTKDVKDLPFVMAAVDRDRRCHSPQESMSTAATKAFLVPVWEAISCSISSVGALGKQAIMAGIDAGSIVGRETSQLAASAADALVRDVWPAAADMLGSIPGAVQEAVEDASSWVSVQAPALGLHHVTDSATAGALQAWQVACDLWNSTTEFSSGIKQPFGVEMVQRMPGFAWLQWQHGKAVLMVLLFVMGLGLANACGWMVDARRPKGQASCLAVPKLLDAEQVLGGPAAAQAKVSSIVHIETCARGAGSW